MAGAGEPGAGTGRSGARTKRFGIGTRRSGAVTRRFGVVSRGSGVVSGRSGVESRRSRVGDVDSYNVLSVIDLQRKRPFDSPVRVKDLDQAAIGAGDDLNVGLIFWTKEAYPIALLAGIYDEMKRLVSREAD